MTEYKGSSSWQSFRAGYKRLLHDIHQLGGEVVDLDMPANRTDTQIGYAVIDDMPVTIWYKYKAIPTIIDSLEMTTLIEFKERFISLIENITDMETDENGRYSFEMRSIDERLGDLSIDDKWMFDALQRMMNKHSGCSR